MIEQNYPCAGNHQSAQIIMVSFDPTLKRNQRLLCQKCLDDFQLPTKIEGFQKTLDSIQDMFLNRVNQQQFLIDKMITFIEPLQKVFQSVRDNLLKSLDALIKVITDWKLQFQQISKNKLVYSFQDELESLVYRQQNHKQQEVFEQINKMNQTYTKTIINQLLILKEDPFKEIELKLKNCEEMLSNQFLNYDNQIKINTKINISLQLKKISKVESEKVISHIIFDKTGQMMISTNQGKVGVWNFSQGNLQFQTSFIAHNNSEIKRAILISNQNHYIITAAEKKIKIFQRNNEICWKCIFEYQKLKNSIGCMIINGNENYLFTSSENIISVWRLNFLQTQMLTCQQLLDQHKWAINSMSLNKSENQLVSCSKDKKLIVWGLNKNNQWEYKYDVKQSILESGNALYFLKDSQFIWVSGEQDGLDSVYVYEEQCEQFQEVLNKTLKLPKNQNQSSISPVVYIDQQKNIILISQKNDIYLLREKSDGNLCIETQINRAILSHHQSQSLTQDGKYLVYSYYDNKDDRNYFSVNEIIETSY